MQYSDQAIERAAKAAHEIHTIYCAALGDHSHLPWEGTPTEIRDSVKAGVRAALEGLSPEVLHQRWVDYKFAQGWTWGPRKSLEDKTHPNLVPWSQLPQWDQAKDVIFDAVVRGVFDHHCLITVSHASSYPRIHPPGNKGNCGGA